MIKQFASRFRGIFRRLSSLALSFSLKIHGAASLEYMQIVHFSCEEQQLTDSKQCSKNCSWQTIIIINITDIRWNAYAQSTKTIFRSQKLIICSFSFSFARALFQLCCLRFAISKFAPILCENQASVYYKVRSKPSKYKTTSMWNTHIDKQLLFQRSRFLASYTFIYIFSVVFCVVFFLYFW